MSEWISVKDRLPKAGMYVIFAMIDGNVEYGYMVERDDGGLHFNDSIDDEPLVQLSGVTHWMLLPDPPEA